MAAVFAFPLVVGAIRAGVLGLYRTERLGVDVNQAFILLRNQARGRNERLSDLARGFVDGTQSTTIPASAAPRTPRPGTRKPRPDPRPAP